MLPIICFGCVAVFQKKLPEPIPGYPRGARGVAGGLQLAAFFAV